MKYLKSEHLKFRRTFFNKLLIIAPLITAVFAWLMAGFTGFQYMSLYWWYSFLLPGTITVLCYLSNQKEIRADKYYSVYSILDDTLSNSELGEWVGYIRKLAVIDSNGKILLQQDTEKATFKTLADIADSKPDAAYIIPFLNVYTVKDGNTQELIVDVNGGYHKAILNSFVTDKDTIFRYNQKTEATAEGEFTINTQNCTQLLCGDKVYQITDETVPYENIGEYIDIIAESYTFDNDTKLQIPKEELYHIDWSGKEKSSQKREQWTIGGIYEILDKDRTDSVAVEVNSEYRVAKCQ